MAIYYVKEFQTRRIWTPFGDLYFMRRVYVNRRTGKLRYKVDEYFGFSVKNYVQEIFILMFVRKIPQVYNYKSITEWFNEQFSPRTISNLLKRLNFRVVPKKLTNKCLVLYRCTDGIFLNAHKRKRNEFKNIVLFTGVKHGYKNDPNKLINKVIIPFEKGLKASQMAKKLEEFIYLIYGEVLKFKLIGDGARWIDNLASYMNIPTVRYIDNFHFKMWLKILIGLKLSKNKTPQFINRFPNTNSFKEYLLKTKADENGELKFTKNEEQAFKYLVKNFRRWKHTQREEIISCIEGIQGNIIAPIFKSKRSFNEGNREKLILLTCAAYNGWEVTNDDDIKILRE